MSEAAAGFSPDAFQGNMLNDYMAFEAQLRASNDQPGTSAQAYTVDPSTEIIADELQKMHDAVQKTEKDFILEGLTPEDRETHSRAVKKLLLILNIEQKCYNPGRFLWLWFLGLQMPGIGLNGEPHIPVEILQELIGPEACNLDTVIRQQNIHTRICNSAQHTTIREKCKEKDLLKDLDLVNQFTTLTLVARSDLHRAMGSLRKEGSRKTKCEHDVWNVENRVKVVHFNFAEFYQEPTNTVEDLCKYDYTITGRDGYWYKGRNNMRCIECAGPECKLKFTPNDFVVHDCRFEPKFTSEVTHVGLDPNNWPRMIMIKDENDKENIEAWKKFSTNCQKVGKRAYDDAEPQAPPRKRIALAKGVSEDDDDEDIEIDVEEIREEMECDDEFDEEEEEEVYDCDSRKLYPVNVRGPSGYTTKMCTAEECFNIMCKTLLTFSDEQLEALQNFDIEKLDLWRKEEEFRHNVLIQKEQWQKIREHPKFVCKATSHFDAQQNQFVNMRFFNTASKGVRMEIQKLTDEMREIYKNTDLLMMDRLKKEQELLRNLSEEAMRVLNNVPPPPPPPPPMPKQKAIPPVVTPVPITPITPISFPNINFAQLAQQLAQQLASGAKLPLPQITLPNIPVPQVSPVVTSPVAAPSAFTPSAPSTPVLPQTPVLPPVLPMLPNPDLLKAQLALASPALLPLLYPTSQFKLPTFEQISQFLKATAVKN